MDFAALRLMLERSIASYEEHAPLAGTTFFDRGIPDTLCYSRLVGLPLEDEILEACGMYRYSGRIFLTPPWQEIYATDAERKQPYSEAVRTYELMAEAYEDCGYEVVEIPKASPKIRADFIVSTMPG